MDKDFFLPVGTRRQPARTAPDVSLAATTQRQSRPRSPDLSHDGRRSNPADLWSGQHARVFLPVAIVRQHAVKTGMQILTKVGQTCRTAPKSGRRSNAALPSCNAFTLIEIDR